MNYYIVCILFLILLVGGISVKYFVLYKEVKNSKYEVSDTDLKMIQTIAKLEESNDLLTRAQEVVEKQYEGKIRKLSSEIEKLKEEKSEVGLKLSKYVLENKGQSTLIKDLETRIEGLRNKDIYKMCFEN